MVPDKIQQEIIDSNICVTLEDENKEYYVACLNYRVILGLYELANDESPDSVSWDDCVQLITGSREVRDEAVDVLRRTVTGFAEKNWFNYRAKAPEPIPEGAPGVENGVIKSVEFFPRDVSFSVIDWLFIQAEIGHYRYLRSIGKACTWREYTAKLLEKGPLWDALRTAFQEALDRIDFRPAWAAGDWG